MRNVLYKEFKLSASLLTYFFIAFSLMFFIPGYPILCGVFFVTLGIFKSFQNMVETNDLVFSFLLPVGKKDIIKGKFLFVCIIESISLFIMGLICLIRNTFLVDSTVYRQNFLMNANAFALGVAFVMFSLFNLLFVAGFFKTSYQRTKPFLVYLITVFMVLGIAEALHHFPGLAFFNAFGSEYLPIQLMTLSIGIIIYLLISYLAYRLSCDRFAKIDM